MTATIELIAIDPATIDIAAEQERLASLKEENSIIGFCVEIPELHYLIDIHLGSPECGSSCTKEAQAMVDKSGIELAMVAKYKSTVFVTTSINTDSLKAMSIFSKGLTEKRNQNQGGKQMLFLRGELIKELATKQNRMDVAIDQSIRSILNPHASMSDVQSRMEASQSLLADIAQLSIERKYLTMFIGPCPTIHEFYGRLIAEKDLLDADICTERVAALHSLIRRCERTFECE